MGFKHSRFQLHSLLQACYRKPHPLCPFVKPRVAAYSNGSSSTSTSTSNFSPCGNQPPTDVAILGAGITGLTCAYLLSRALPSAKIALFEAQDKVGGWLRSSRVDVDDGGYVIFEHGPRTLRPSGPSAWATLDLIHKLGLGKDVLATPKTSEAARNRYIYYPDHLVLMPGPGQGLFDMASTIFREPMLLDAVWGVFSEPFQPKRPDSLQDESVGSFLRRRVSASLVDNIASAILHGIYAGDIYKLSARSLLRRPWYLEGSRGSVLPASFRDMAERRKGLTDRKDQDFLALLRSKHLSADGVALEELRQLEDLMSLSSVYTFKNGLEQLALVLESELEKAANVSVFTGQSIDELYCRDSDGKIFVTPNKPSRGATHKPDDIPTLFSHAITTLPDFEPSVRGLQAVRSSPGKDTKSFGSGLLPHRPTVMVVNLYFPPPTTLTSPGFGYLIPRSIPFSQNPEFALGVVFDSDATPELGTARGLRLTVMLGGHWWDGWPSYPSPEDGIRMARAVVKRHLGITAEPTASRAVLQRKGIPQYEVGHVERVKQLARKEGVQNFGGRLAFAGAGFFGVGVNDCVRSAYEAVDRMVEGKGGTGLEGYGDVEYVIGGGGAAGGG